MIMYIEKDTITGVDKKPDGFSGGKDHRWSVTGL